MGWRYPKGHRRIAPHKFSVYPWKRTKSSKSHRVASSSGMTYPIANEAAKLAEVCRENVIPCGAARASRSASIRLPAESEQNAGLDEGVRAGHRGGPGRELAMGAASLPRQLPRPESSPVKYRRRPSSTWPSLRDVQAAGLSGIGPASPPTLWQLYSLGCARSTCADSHGRWGHCMFRPPEGFQKSGGAAPRPGRPFVEQWEGDHPRMDPAAQRATATPYAAG